MTRQLTNGSWTLLTALIAACSLSTTAPAHQPVQARKADPQQQKQPADWKQAENSRLRGHVRLTSPERFVKAGEAYFSPDESQIIFQAIEQPTDGGEPDEYYAMFVAEVVYGDDGRITGIENIQRISPEGSANTCGWFHPTEDNTVIFGSTITPPEESSSPGYQRESGRYKWMFPKEMNIVQVDLDQADGTKDTLTPIVENDNAYMAECSISRDGRHLLYASLESNEGDLFVRDLKNRGTNRIVQAEGYDGGPFFSPDGKRICYRSDRQGNNLLQVFVAELAFNQSGQIIGIEREFQLTRNANVNWAPFWHPDGKHLVYTTSEFGHENYEVFIMDADDGRSTSADDQSNATATTRYGTSRRRVTNATGFDGLPVFNGDGSIMMWTSQRGESGTSQIWAAQFVMDLEPETETEETAARRSENPYVTDPETGIIYIYNPTTHELTAYNPRTHKKREVTDSDEMRKAMRLFRNKQSGNGSAHGNGRSGRSN